jgi:hypothetical protein
MQEKKDEQGKDQRITVGRFHRVSFRYLKVRRRRIAFTTFNTFSVVFPPHFGRL